MHLNARPLYWASTLFAILVSSTNAAKIRIQIHPSAILPNPHELPASTHATLISGTSPPLYAPLRVDNTLEFPNVTTSGPHLLSIYTLEYNFAPFRVDISPSTTSDPSAVLIEGIWETYPGSEWSARGVPLIAAPAATVFVSAKILKKKEFIEQRSGFSPASLLKNPMILLGVVALGLTVGMPKLMETMDPEMKAEYEEMHKKSPVTGLVGAMQGQGSSGGGFDLASYMAGKKPSETEGTTSSGTDAGAGGARARYIR